MFIHGLVMREAILAIAVLGVEPIIEFLFLVFRLLAQYLD